MHFFVDINTIKENEITSFYQMEYFIIYFEYNDWKLYFENI